MLGKLIGSALILASSACVGTLYRRWYCAELDTFYQLKNALFIMQSELRFNRTPVPQLFFKTANETKGTISKMLSELSSELEKQVAPNVACCMHSVLASSKSLSSSITDCLEQLGESMGRFDLEEQLLGMEAVQSICQRRIDFMENRKSNQLKNAMTFSLCAGVAVIIVLI